MNAEILNAPKCLNMGFHYTQQFSRRTRVNVMGLVDHSTEEWERWYYKTHELESLQKMADAGYKLIEIHFMYGFGLEGEKEEYELTKKMVENAHKVGIKVFGYFQFFSIQKELFFIENPWAKECIQLKADGTFHEYRYDRPALCFSHQKVKDYYLKGIETGLKYCDLDGIRLDNDYYRGCFCPKCQEEFKKYLKDNFPPEKARRVLGYEQVDEMELVPFDFSEFGQVHDQLWAETVKFWMQQRQKMMKLLHDKIVSIKPDAILGGNPAVCRRLNDCSRIHVYAPDLGETHHLVCAENSLFPEAKGNSIKHQVAAYKHGQANNFKVFPSHHLYDKNGKTRWPETKEECALSLCEALAFGGHTACTTWGIRMDESEDKTLYERPHFIEALTPVKDFLEENESVYRDAECSAEVGIYINRETQICDFLNCNHSLHGTIQLLLKKKVPFKFVDTDEDKKLEALKVLIVGDVRLVSNEQLERFKAFAKENKIILTGDSCLYDEYFLKRNADELNVFLEMPNVKRLKGSPEKVNPEKIGYHGSNYTSFPYPENGGKFLDALNSLYTPFIEIDASPFVTVDVFENPKGETFIHILNYCNNILEDVDIEIEKTGKAELLTPESIGCASMKSSQSGEKTKITLRKLHTYAVVKIS
jgi:hypothetical protein